jgi:hypothetical protein
VGRWKKKKPLSLANVGAFQAEAVTSESSLIQGTFDLIQGTFDLIQGTCDLIQGTFDLIMGTFDLIHECGCIARVLLSLLDCTSHCPCWTCPCWTTVIGQGWKTFWRAPGWVHSDNPVFQY